MKLRRVRRGQRVSLDYQPTSTRTAPIQNRQSVLRMWKRMIKLCFMVALLVGILWWLEVKKVVVSGSTAQNESISKRVDESLTTPWQRNLFRVSLTSLTQRVEEEYRAEVAEVVITKDWLRRQLVVKVSERRPTLHWQGTQVVVVDQEGVILGGANPENTLNLVVVRDSTQLPLRVGERVATTQFVSFVKEVMEHCRTQTGLTPRYGEVGTSISELVLRLDEAFYIRFDSTRSAMEQLEEVTRALEDAHTRGMTPHEYIDVRLSHKAYYR